jgi:hypothetical protein
MFTCAKEGKGVAKAASDATSTKHDEKKGAGLKVIVMRNVLEYKA